MLPGYRILATALIVGTLLWATRPAEAFRVLTLPVITESLPTAGLLTHMHWDLREFPNCQVPFAFSSTNMVDVNGDGNVNNADTTAASNAVNAALAAWTNVTPAIITLSRTPAAAVANQAFRIDGVNVVGFGTNAGDDVADPAPVGANVGGNLSIIHPGPNGVINSVLNDTPAGPGPGDDLIGLSGVVMVVMSGPNQIIETTPVGDDRWVTGINVGANVRFINGGFNTRLETMPLTDDVASAAGAGSISTGPNGIVNSTPNNQNIANTSTFGITAILVNNTSGAIQEADITLNTTSMIPDENGVVMRPVPWVTTGQRLHFPFNATNVAGMAGIGFNKDIQATTTHELGHAIGIAHPEENQFVANGLGPWGRIGITGMGAGGVLSAATVTNLMVDDEINGASTLVYTGADGILQTAAGGGDRLGQVCITGMGPGGALSAATIANLAIITNPLNDDQINAAMTLITTGANMTCQTTAAGGDVQNIPVGGGSRLAIGVHPASDNTLTTPVVGDDLPCTVTLTPPPPPPGPTVINVICLGLNAICNSGQAIGAIPTMNTNPNCFTGNAPQERSLAQDDQDACNFLYTWDLGDADDPFLFGGPFNTYQTLVQSTVNGRMLNGVQLLQVGQGPVHLLGTPGAGGDDIIVGAGAAAMIRDGGNGIVETTPAGDDAWIIANAAQRVCGGIVAANANLIAAGTDNVLNSTPNNCVNFRFEWLGANEDGNANEHAPLDPDMFDDGLAIVGVAPAAIGALGALGQGFELNRGGTYDMLVTVSHTNQAGRYAGGTPQQRLQFNGYFDWNTDQRFTSAEDQKIWWSGTPTATSASSTAFVSATFQVAPNNNRVILRFRVTVPEDAGDGTSSLYSRMRLDYGEDEGRQLDVNGDNDPAEGVAQFGEVEDYLISLSDKPDQLHLGCLPEYMEPSIPLGQAGTIQAIVELEFAALRNQSVTFRQVGGTGVFEWPDDTLSSASPSFTMLTNDLGRAVVQVNDPGEMSGDVLIEVTVAGTTLKAYCFFNIGFFGGVKSADLNGDGSVDTADLGILLSAFGTGNAEADLNGDGVVDTADLGVLIQVFENN
jgi:hypothetical protein